MIEFLILFLHVLVSPFKARAQLEAEIVVLRPWVAQPRHQPSILSHLISPGGDAWIARRPHRPAGLPGPARDPSQPCLPGLLARRLRLGGRLGSALGGRSGPCDCLGNLRSLRGLGHDADLRLKLRTCLER